MGASAQVQPLYLVSFRRLNSWPSSPARRRTCLVAYLVDLLSGGLTTIQQVGLNISNTAAGN